LQLGDDYEAYGCEPGYGVYNNFNCQLVKACGKAGDVIIFDTNVFHAHGRPTKNRRLTSTIYYLPPINP
jgi:hypothetical protein